VEKFFPEAWLELEYYSLKARNLIIGNLERGKKEGLYRNDINIVLIAELRMHQHISLLRSQFATTQKLSTDRLAKEITMLHLRSITTEKGKLLLDQQKVTEAFKTFGLANTIDPAFADAWYWMARCQELMDLKEEAKLNYEKAYSLDKTFIQAKEAADRIK